MSSFVIPAIGYVLFLLHLVILNKALSVLMVFSKNQQIQTLTMNEIANRHIVESFLRARKHTYKN